MSENRNLVTGKTETGKFIFFNINQVCMIEDVGENIPSPHGDVLCYVSFTTGGRRVWLTAKTVEMLEDFIIAGK